MVKFSSPYRTRSKEEAALNDSADNNDCGALDEQNYVQALGTEDDEDGVSRVTGSSIFTFKQIKRSHSMAQTASDLAKTPGKSVTFSKTHVQPSTPTRTGSEPRGQSRTPRMDKKVQFVSTTPHRLGKRITVPSLRSDSDSELSPSDSEEENGVDEVEREQKAKKEYKENPKTPGKTQSKGLSAALYKTPAKKRKSSTSETAGRPTMVEEYFEAHGSSKVLTSDRTLERLHTPKFDRDTLVQLLDGKPSSYADEIKQLHDKLRKHFSKWMLQLQLGFSVLVYGLGSKKALLEDFRVSYLAQEIHLVVNGFFPSITLKSILNALTFEILEHQGTFRTPSDQIQFITKTLKDRTFVSVSADIVIVTVFIRFKSIFFFFFFPFPRPNPRCFLFCWTFSLTMTHFCRGIFKVLVKFQLENKDSPSYTGMSFQDFYQRCREAFLVNSDLTLRTQLTEFRDHKLIRTRKGADGVEFLIVAVDTGTLTDFLENEEVK
ncbi:origin recognition complex subunit 2 [Cynoglossus semilaevis]|uniref:origin recognition complex subunit 2 n=1 Tax=Cynoglossus semilaevis TaxID=244447 RepID=UPI000D626F7E|nr:origin recognition complex subunit 2 [Cynoglossus semilaevis]